MNDALTPAAKPAGTFVDVQLDQAIVRGEQTITSVQLRKPGSGELRGLQMVDILNQDYLALEKLLPRITSPILTKADVAAMDPADLLACGTECAGFLLQKAKKPDFLD